jgi:putative AdoMet-dependent methyltransferase
LIPFGIYCAAPRCKKVFAVDVSSAMLQYLKNKAKENKLTNIEYHHAGFLTYDHTGEPADAFVSVAVLHHLPDFWKLVALSRAADMLRPQGRMWLMDVVFPFGAGEYEEAMDRWVSSTEASLGRELAEETVVHISNEYSTFDWILEGMLQRSGFTIDEKRILDPVPAAVYICTRRGCS